MIVAWPWAAASATPVLSNDRLMLRAATMADYKEWRTLRKVSREFLKPYEPRWTEADLARHVFAARIKRAGVEATEGTDFNFFIFLKQASGTQLVGGVTLSNIRRRAAQHATLGYWMGEQFAGKGIMSEAVSLLLPFAFVTLDLHRIHAAFLPFNTASRRVLEKNGFREEGYAESYLQIDGKWADHVLFGLNRERYESRLYRRVFDMKA
jgi:ribosomal-protein-alanine N-acetyltransferase